jgi:hypothetical protein
MNVYQYMKSEALAFPPGSLDLWKTVVSRMRAEISSAFDAPNIMLTKPSFFARITGGKAARTVNDEYWHSHVDKLQYGSFVYTGLLYLNDYGRDFQGGRFAFLDGSANRTVEPRSGRLLAFTSGEENAHQVREVLHGDRYVLTVAFTCDPKAVFDPNMIGT